MTWTEPDSNDPSFAGGVLAAAAICGYWLAFGLFRAVAAGAAESGWAGASGRLVLDVTLAGLSTIAAVSAVRSLRGRRTKASRRLTGGRATSLFALAAAAVALYGLAAIIGEAQLGAGAGAPPVGWVLFGGLVGLGVLAVAGAATEGWALFRAGRARLILASDPSYAGVPLTVVLEVPFPLHEAPELDGALSLVGPGPDGWSRPLRIRAGDWEPAGARASRFVLSVDGAAGPADDLAAPWAAIRVPRSGRAVRRRCSLVATARGGRPWSAHLVLPVEIARPIAA